MKLTVTLIAVLFMATTGWSQNRTIKQEVPSDYGYIIKVGQQMPDITMTLTDGTTVTTSDLKGKVVMLQFTASWCGVCRREMPHIENDIWQKHKNRKDFALIGIDLDEPLETVKKFGSDMKITYPLALDPGGEIFYTFAENYSIEVSLYSIQGNDIYDKKYTDTYRNCIVQQRYTHFF